LKGDRDQAIADYDEAIRLNPKDAQSHNRLAWLLATSPAPQSRNGKRAVELAQRACELTAWKRAAYLDTLAAAHAEAGNFVEAIRWQEKALGFAEFLKSSGEAARMRLELYRQEKPYRESP
jgi:tetratricopeptide (TPR) repeat protein